MNTFKTYIVEDMCSFCYLELSQFIMRNWDLHGQRIHITDLRKTTCCCIESLFIHYTNRSSDDSVWKLLLCDSSHFCIVIFNQHFGGERFEREMTRQPFNEISSYTKLKTCFFKDLKWNNITFSYHSHSHELI